MLAWIFLDWAAVLEKLIASVVAQNRGFKPMFYNVSAVLMMLACYLARRSAEVWSVYCGGIMPAL